MANYKTIIICAVVTAVVITVNFYMRDKINDQCAAKGGQIVKVYSQPLDSCILPSEAK